MAEKKRSSTGSKSSGKAKSAKSHASSAKKASQKKPIRREVGAFVCLFLAILAVLGLFRVDAVFIELTTQLFRGILGAGIYAMPFALVLDFVILLFHDGRPVRLRVWSTSVAALCIGMLVHLLGDTASIEWSFVMVGELWRSGVEGTSGGLVAGFLAQFLELVISKIGAVLLTVVVFGLSVLTGCNMTVGSIIRAIKNRPRPEYDPPSREHADPAEVLVNRVAQKQVQRAERKRSAIAEFDLPVDEPPSLPKADEKPKKASKAENKSDLFLESLGDVEELGRSKKKQKEMPAAPKKLPELVLEQERVSEPELVSEPESELAFQAEKILIPEPVPSSKKAQFEELAAETMKPESLPLVVKKSEAAPMQPVPSVQEESKKVKKEEARLEAAKIENEIAMADGQQMIYHYPSLSLLKASDGMVVDGTDEMQLNAERLSDKLESFGVKASIVNVIRGPSVTRFELELDRGVKLSKITNMADDIALALGVTSVRISAIPDKISVVGIEVPNRLRSMVRLRDVLDSVDFDKSKSKLSFAVGKDISGKCIICDIVNMPHLLIAGTTGQGKSVCMNSLIISLLFKSTPEEVRLIMVDPKMVEMGVYNGIPHMLIPVVTDPKKAAGALQWAVTEMMKRYRLMADAGAKSLKTYNEAIAGAEDQKPLPQIVVIIDELADLMLVAAREVEESICRIAQMGRAAGIHLVIATQRPSADVITGTMKSNVPSRIAFTVASAMESRIILDASGAEKLVGKGDMIYAPLGHDKRRVQGCLVEEGEVQAVVDFLKRNATAEYDDDVMAQIEQKAEQSGKNGAAAVSAKEEDDGDELLPAAVDVFLETGMAAVSMLQRRLKLGYARAARIVDEMEDRGIVGPFNGSKPRQMLITKEQWQQMQGLAPVLEDNLPVEEEIP